MTSACSLTISCLNMPFAVILSGVFGVPKSVVAQAAYNALQHFNTQMQSADGKHHLKNVRFVNIDLEATQIFVAVFSQLQQQTAC